MTFRFDFIIFGILLSLSFSLTSLGSPTILDESLEPTQEPNLKIVEEALQAAEVDVKRFTAIASFWIIRSEKIKKYWDWSKISPPVSNLSKSIPGLKELNAGIAAELLLDAYARQLHLANLSERLSNAESESIDSSTINLRGQIATSFTASTLEELLSVDSAASCFEFPLFPDLTKDDRPNNPAASGSNFHQLCAQIKRSGRPDTSWAASMRRFFALLQSLELGRCYYGTDPKTGDDIELLGMLADLIELCDLTLSQGFKDESLVYPELVDDYRLVKDDLTHVSEVAFVHLSRPFKSALRNAVSDDQTISILEIANGLSPRFSQKLLAEISLDESKLTRLQMARLSYLRSTFDNIEFRQLEYQQGDPIQLISKIEIDCEKYVVGFSEDSKNFVVCPYDSPPFVSDVATGERLFDLAIESGWSSSVRDHKRNGFAMWPKGCLSVGFQNQEQEPIVGIYSLSNGELL